jgi:hypothetical protein
MNYQVLKTEIETDPLGRGYSGMSDDQIAADLNIEYRTRPRDVMSGSEILNQTDKAEYDVLQDAAKETYWKILHMGDLDPFGFEAQIMIDIFGGGSETISNLQAARMISISRGFELGLGAVRVSDVEKAKA